jgi:hypothetical protein
MINLQVDDLEIVPDRLIEEGVTVDPKRESYDFGRFGWITDQRKSCRALAACLNGMMPPIQIGSHKPACRQ